VAAAAAIAAHAAPPRFPAPPPGAVVLAQELGLDALGLAVVPHAGAVGLQASIVGPQGLGSSHLAVRFLVAGRDGRTQTRTGAPCGQGCYRADAAIGRPGRITVVVGGKRPRRATFVLPRVWPPPPAGLLVARAARVWRSLHSLVDRDTLSDGRYAGTTVWKIVAPDRIAYHTRDSGDAVIIGARRWDRSPGRSTWTESTQLPVRQPVPDWVGAVDARLLGTVRVRGRPARRVSFFDPGTPGWFTILVEQGTLHTVDVRMIATAHFMHDRYGPFDAPIRIVPPSRSKRA
jgi:hypothetical protein